MARTLQERLDDVDAAIAKIEANCQEIDIDELRVRFPNYEALLKERRTLQSSLSRRRFSTLDMGGVA